MMPKEYFDKLDDDLDLREMVRELNERFRRIAEVTGALEGYEGREIVKSAQLSMGGHRVVQLKVPRQNADAVNLRYLRDNAVTALPGQDFVAKRLLIAEAGIRVTERAVEPFDLVPLQQLEDVIADTIGAIQAGDDLVIGGSDPVIIDHLDSGVNPGTYGSSTEAIVLTVNARGHITSIFTVPIASDGLVVEIPAGALPGSVFTTSTAWPWHRLFVNGILQRQVAAFPGPGEYTYVGTTITFGYTILAGSWVFLEGAGDPPTTQVTETLTGMPIDTFTLANEYATHALWVNGIRQKPVTTVPLLGEYRVVGTTLTTGFVLATTDWGSVIGNVLGAPLEVPSGSRPGTVFTTSVAYTTHFVYCNGVRQRQVGAAPSVGEYTLSGTTLTMGQTIESTDWLVIEDRSWL